MKPVDLASYISDLLYEHDCVIIAELGGFVANYKPSFLHPAHHTLSPPSKKIAFNASLKINDGLLASYIAETNAVSYQEACKIISHYVEDSMLLLDTGKKLNIYQVGSLFYNPERKLQFAPDHSINYLRDSFGLTTVHSPAIRREATLRKNPERQFSTPQPSAPVRRIKKSKGWKWIELVPAAAVLTLLLLNPDIIRNMNRNIAGLLPEFGAKKIVQTELTVPEVKTQDADLVPETTSSDHLLPESSSYLDTTLGHETTDTLPEEETGKEKPLINEKPATGIDSEVKDASTILKETDTPSPGEENYYLVAGCFRMEANALALHGELISKGYPSLMPGKYKGLHLVTFRSAVSFKEAHEALDELKSSGQDAWVLKK